MSDLIKPDECFGITEAVSKEEVREIIADFEARARLEENQIDVPVKHYFSKDVYAREVRIPAGSLVVGKLHKFQNLNILSEGEISVLSIDGAQRMKAPCTIVSSPGVKRLAYAHTDVVWTTIHGTNETDVEKIEDVFIAKSYEELNLLSHEEKLCFGSH